MRQRLLVYPVFYSDRATKFIYANQERIILRYVVRIIIPILKPAYLVMG